jgi:hypothetical protein
LSETSPIGANYKVMAFHCASCGAPFGGMEYFAAGILLKQQEKVLQKIEKAVAALDHRLHRIEQLVGR